MTEALSTTIDFLIKLAPHTQIAHHIPGRVRLKIAISALEILQGVDVEEVLRCLPGVRDLRINPAAMSAVVEYDERLLPFSLWERLAKSAHQPEVAAEIRKHLEGLADK